MAASINDKFTETTNGSRPVPTTLTALLPSGASPGTATCGALTGWATATAVHFIIYTIDVNGRKVSGSQTDWKGVVSGSTITGLVLKAGTNNGYAIGAVVEAAPTAAWADDVTEGILVEHKQTGAHAAITADSVASAGAVSGTTITGSGTVQGATVVATGDVQLRSFSLETIHNQIASQFVYSGGIWTGDAYASTRAASMTAMVVYTAGRRFSVSAVTARSFTASKDTYVDVDNTGALVYTEVNNNVASPALTAGSIRVAIVVTGASNIASVGSINQGQWNKGLPAISSQTRERTDSLGNLICCRDPNNKVLGGCSAAAVGSIASATPSAITNGLCNIIIPGSEPRQVTIITDWDISSDTANLGEYHIYIDGASVKSHRTPMNGTGGWTQQTGVVFNTTLAAGSHTVALYAARATGSGNCTVNNGTMAVLLT